MTRHEHFFYDLYGDQQHQCNSYTVLISTVPLPDFAKEYVGKCAHHHSDKFPKNAPIGTMFNIAFGDPRIMMECKLISKNQEGFPPKLLEQISMACMDSVEIFGFEYSGGAFYVDTTWVCRLEDLCGYLL